MFRKSKESISVNAARYSFAVPCKIQPPTVRQVRIRLQNRSECGRRWNRKIILGRKWSRRLPVGFISRIPIRSSSKRSPVGLFSSRRTGDALTFFRNPIGRSEKNGAQPAYLSRSSPSLSQSGSPHLCFGTSSFHPTKAQFGCLIRKNDNMSHVSCVITPHFFALQTVDSFS